MAFTGQLGTDDSQLGNILLGESNRGPATFDLEITENINLSQITIRGKSTVKTVSEVIILSEVLTNIKAIIRNISETIIFNQSPGEVTARPVTINESLIINQTLTKLKVKNLTITETINLTQSLVRSGSIFNRAISEVLPLKGGFTRYSRSGGIAFPIREVEIIKVAKKCTTIIEANASAIVLPCPELGDKEKNLHSQVVKRSMDGDLYTYVRRNDLQQLTYTFVLGRPMCYDLQDFVDKNIVNMLTLTNWKGEIWKVQIITNPLDFVAKTLWENEGERWEVMIEFQGIRIL